MAISSEALNLYEQKRQERIGQVFGKLTVVSWVSRTEGYLVRCACGNEFKSKYYHLTQNVTRSCRDCFVSKARGRPVLPDNLGEKRHLINQYKQSAKRRNIPYQLTEDQAIQLLLGDCHYCGAKPSNKVVRSTTANSTLLYSGIDRYDNSVGYTTENCVSCCTFCNTAKLDKTIQQWEEWLDRIVKFRERSTTRAKARTPKRVETESTPTG